MKKLFYQSPLVEICPFDTEELMQVSGASDRPIEPGMLPAPKRQPEVF